MPVHVGGLMADAVQIKAFARRHRLWLVEDAAHAFPAALREGTEGSWRRCGQNTADVTCFSFYANKTITTGEGGMAVTGDRTLGDRMRQMSLHGLSHDAWNRYAAKSNSWDYKIVAPGYKYNLTDVAAAIGLHQLERAEAMRCEREEVARRYAERLGRIAALELPPRPADRIHSWHLYPIRLTLESLCVSRNEMLGLMREQGVGCSVHWRPLHLHPYYQERFGWKPEHLPVASSVWERLISLPIFPGMREEEEEHVVNVVGDLCRSKAVGTRAGTLDKPEWHPSGL